MATSVGMESKGSQPDLEYGHQNHADADPRDDEEKLAANRPYLWTSAKADFDDGKPCEFLGFEPCYTACIKDLEWQILRKIQTLKPAHDNTNLTQEMAPILIQYSQLIEALQRIRSIAPIVDTTYSTGTTNRFVTKYAGTPHHIPLTNEDDKVRHSLSNSILLILLNFIYHWDIASNLARRFGNLTEALGRIIVGVAGGASLLIPMIIMTYVTAIHYRLVIVSTATILFAIGIALTSASKDAVIGATAAYAAVMVVYIGGS